MSWFVVRNWNNFECDISAIHFVSDVQQSSEDVMFMGLGSDGAGTWYIRKKVVDYLPGMVLAYSTRRHGVSIVYVSIGLQVSGHGCMRSGLLVNQATTQSWWLVMASYYDSQGHIVICGCVSAAEEGMKYSEWIRYSRSSMRRHPKATTLHDPQW